jgi:hypothetical protein
VNELKTWLGHTLRQMTWAKANNHDKIMGERLRRDAEMRRPKLRELNAIAASLKGHSALGSQELALTVLNSDWEEMERKIGLMSKEESHVVSSLQQSPPVKTSTSSSASKGPAAQISARIEKMLEVLATIERQLTSNVLAGKQFENLPAQSDTLDTIYNVRKPKFYLSLVSFNFYILKNCFNFQSYSNVLYFIQFSAILNTITNKEFMFYEIYLQTKIFCIPY